MLACSSCPELHGAPRLMHITCAWLAESTFEFRNWPLLTAALCHEHKEDDYEEIRDLPPITLGESVVCYLEDGNLVRVLYTFILFCFSWPHNRHIHTRGIFFAPCACCDVSLRLRGHEHKNKVYVFKSEINYLNRLACSCSVHDDKFEYCCCLLIMFMNSPIKREEDMPINIIVVLS